jgi:hypothetical protein
MLRYVNLTDERATAGRALEQEKLINDIAETIQRRGWRLPALLALEAGRPLAFIGGQLLWLAQPTLSLIISASTIGHIARLLEEPAALDSLIARLEE